MDKKGKSGHKGRERKTHFAAVGQDRNLDGRPEQEEESDGQVQNDGDQGNLEKNGIEQKRTSYSARRNPETKGAAEETDVGSREEGNDSASLSANGSRRGSLAAGSLQQKDEAVNSTKGSHRVRFSRSESGREGVAHPLKGQRGEAESGTEQEPEADSGSESGSWSEGESSGSESSGGKWTLSV